MPSAYFTDFCHQMNIRRRLHAQEDVIKASCMLTQQWEKYPLVLENISSRMPTITSHLQGLQDGTIQFALTRNLIAGIIATASDELASRTTFKVIFVMRALVTRNQTHAFENLCADLGVTTTNNSKAARNAARRIDRKIQKPAGAKIMARSDEIKGSVHFLIDHKHLHSMAMVMAGPVIKATDDRIQTAEA